MRIFLCEIYPLDPATGAVTTLRYCSGLGYDADEHTLSVKKRSGAFVSVFLVGGRLPVKRRDGVTVNATLPVSPLTGNHYYLPRIEQPASYKRSLSADGKASTSIGELILVNADGALNNLASLFFDGRTINLSVGDDKTGLFTTILTTQIESVSIEMQRIAVRLRDKAVTLDAPFATTKYAGNNLLPAGVEGTADDLKGQIKPRLFGRVALMTPVMVNTSKLIYQVNDGPTDAIVNVYDGGAYLSKAPDYTSLADMEANAPASGTFRSWGGYFRLGSSPFKAVSACVVESWDHTKISAAGIIKRLLTEKGVTDWVAADFTLLDQKNVGSLGVVVDGEETTASLLERIAASVGAGWYFDAFSRFRIARLDAPAGTPKFTFTDNEILDIERPPQDRKPLWRETIEADRSYAVQDKNNLAGIVPDDRAAWFTEETRKQVVESSAIKNSRLLAEEKTDATLLNGIATAKAEAQRRLNLYSVRRDSVELRIADPAGLYSTLELGDVVSVQTNRLGYSAGRLLTVVGLELDYQRNYLIVSAWG